jgi:hypothetical protein
MIQVLRTQIFNVTGKWNMDSDIYIKEEHPKTLYRDTLRDCVDEDNCGFSIHYDTLECVSNLLIHVPDDEPAYLKLTSEKQIFYQNEQIEHLKLQPGLTHLFWCKPELSVNGLDIFVTHQSKIWCPDLFNNLIISPLKGQALTTVSFKRRALKQESEFQEGRYKARLNPISPPIAGLRYSADRINFLHNKKEVSSDEKFQILDHLVNGTRKFQNILPLTKTSHSTTTWFRDNSLTFEDIPHLRISRGPKHRPTGPIVLPMEPEDQPGS